ncbi:MAG: insulinase family protein [Acidobacteriota bacterium]
MRWWAFLLAILLLQASGAPSAAAQRPRVPPPEYLRSLKAREDQGNLVKVVLRNGLTVLIEEQPQRPLLAVGTYVKDGYFQAQERASYLSKLVARSLQQGEAARQIHLLGGALDVAQGPDDTYFYSVVPSDNAEKVLEIHAGLLASPNFDRQEVWNAHQMLGHSLKYDPLTPQQFASRRLMEMAYPGSVLEGADLASCSELKRDVLAAEAAAFHRQVYRPENVIVAFSGSVLRENILKKIVDEYGEIRASGPPAAAASRSTGKSLVAGGQSFRYEHLRGDIQQPYILMGYRTPGVQHPDYLPLSLLAYVLTEGHASVLGHSAVAEGGSAVSVDSSLKASEQGGLFQILAVPLPGKVDGAEVEVLAQLELLKREGVPRYQLNRAKAIFLVEYYEQLETLEQRAYLLARHESLGSFLDRQRIPEKIEALSAAHLSRVLERYFSDSNLSLLEYFPRDAEARSFTEASILETLRLLVSTAAGRKTRPEALEAMEKRAFTAPEFKPSFFEYSLKHTSVLRGPDVYFQEDHTAPVVNVGFFYPGGRINESQHNSGITELMLHMLPGSVAKRKGPIFWHELEGMGANIQIINEPDFFGFQSPVLSDQLGALLKILIDLVRNPELDPEILSREGARVISLAVEEEAAYPQALKSAREKLYRGHPYALTRHGTHESVAGISLESIQEWVKTQMVAVHPTIVIHGDVQGTSFLQGFISTLSDPSYENRPFVKKEVPAEEGSLVSESRDGKLVLAFAGPSRGKRDERVLDVIEQVLAGPGGRLNTSLKESAVAHGAQIFHEPALNGGGIFVSIMTSPGHEEQAKSIAFSEFESLEQQALSREEFMGALVGAITDVYVRQQKRQNYLVELARLALAGEGTDFAQRKIARIKLMSKEDLSSTVRRFFTEREHQLEPPPAMETDQDSDPPASEPEAPTPKPKPPSLRRPPSSPNPQASSLRPQASSLLR